MFLFQVFYIIFYLIKMSIIYITSFSKDLYEASGKDMLKSYLDSGIQDTLVVAFEGFNMDNLFNDPRIIKYDLNKSIFLKEWLFNNQDIIPTYLGGQAKQGINSDVFNNIWNRKASRWFRKIASFEYMIRRFSKTHDYIVWIDCDSLILKKIEPNWIIEKAFQDKDLFYHLGPYRSKKETGIESGIIGFKKGKGYQILQKVFDLYTSKQFRLIKRWDDGYVFRFVIEKCLSLGLVTGVDLADSQNKISDDGAKLDVICKGIFKDYVLHKKGLHKRLGISI